MIKPTGLLLLIVTAVYSLNSQAQASQQQMLEHLINAHRQQQVPPVLSAKLQQPYSKQKAYEVQTQYVKYLLQQRGPAGFKAGLTTKPAQARFNVDEPIAGVLLADSGLEQGRELSQQGYHKMMIEVELGFRLNQTVSQPVANVEALKSMVAEVVPVLEFPELAFDRPKQLQGVDVIAANVAAKSWLAGEGVSPDKLDVNQLPVSLQHNRQTILQAGSGEIMGDQWQALRWLINRMVANGWTIYPEQILITGAIGKMLPAKPGVYQADYEGLGQLAVIIKPGVSEE